MKAVQTNSKTIHVPAEAQQAEKKAPAENSKPQPAAAAETAKVFPVTEPVEGRTDVVAFTDAKNGFRVFVPAELEVYPLGINPVAVLRGENVAKGLRLAIDASAIDGKGPLMPFQVEAFREDFLRLVKNSVKDSANAKKILTSGEVELAGQKAVHVVSTNLTTDGKRRLLRDEYVFVTQNRMFVVMYMMDEKLYPEYQEKIPLCHPEPHVRGHVHDGRKAVSGVSGEDSAMDGKRGDIPGLEEDQRGGHCVGNRSAGFLH